MAAVETGIERTRRLSYEAARAAVAFGEANPDNDELDLTSYSQGYRDAAEQAEAEVRALREALRWAFTEWGEDWGYDEHTDMPSDAPEHECRYGVAPDEGYCLFCDEFWKVYLLVFTPTVAPEPRCPRCQRVVPLAPSTAPEIHMTPICDTCAADFGEERAPEPPEGA